tara:strand:+ start:188 stop:1177 length:990 start_codon:yes stop_codon:yes gene_type:complete
MKILAVDDDPIILELLQHFVSAMTDHEIVTAECVTDALVVLGQQDRPFDCFLLDIQMPGTDGIEFCKILRDTEGYQRTPILMLTAMSEKDHIDSAFHAGATDYITKPFEVNGLKGRLGLVEQIAMGARNKTGKIFAVNAVRQGSEQIPMEQMEVPLFLPFTIGEVDGVIENQAMENYVTQLSRRSLCGSVVMAFTIREVADLHDLLTPYDFTCAITDVSEAISDCLLPTQRLVSYSGNGTYVCVVEGAKSINIDRLVDQINLHIGAMGLSQSDGSALNIRVCAGRPSRLVWRKGEEAVKALRQAHISAEENADRLAREVGSIWISAQGA